MSPIQQMLLGVGAVATKTYVDDVFSTFLYEGTGSAQSINNGIDMSGEGGMTWLKRRSGASDHAITDTVRGAGNSLKANENNSNYSSTNFISAFNSNGFSIGTDADVGSDDETYTSWSFRRASGFFDCVQFTGDGNTSQQISHSLGCIPGMMLVKCTSETMSWAVYHRTTGNTKGLYLNGSGAGDTNSGFWNNTSPTSTHFTVSDADPDAFTTNKNGATYVAYLFAGGESDAANAVSVDFDGSDDTLNIAASDDFHLTGDLTIEGWFKPDAYGSYNAFWCLGNFQATQGVFIYTDANQLLFWKGGSGQIYTSKPPVGQWTHIAVVRSGSTVTMYINGTSVGSYTDSVDFGASNNKTFTIGSDLKNSSVNDDFFNGQISNLRVVKGTALYTSSFRPPTEPLTNITNTKLLCCNNSSVTGSTVTPGTITASSSPTASTDSPFDDPAGFVFGDAGDQNVIKCGSYVGNDAADGPKVYLGWEPQWILIKRTSSTADWLMFDSMRGITTGDDSILYANGNYAEEDDVERLELTPTGFKLTSGSDTINNGDFIYIAIRRPDGYVGKPPELGTDVFNVALGNSNGSPVIPVFAANFPVDFALRRRKDAVDDWDASARLTQGKRLKTNTNDAESGSASADFDSNVGWNDGDFDDRYPSWQWKRHKGMEIITFEGSGSARQIPHSMNAIPEFIILKNRETASNQWYIYHKGLNGGTNPEDYYVKLGASGNAAEAGDSGGNLFNSTAPTSTHFSVGTSSAINESDKGSIAILFSSVEKISKVGYYTGNNSTQTITTGFQPRFVIIKKVSGSDNWLVFDTLRGWTSGATDKELRLNATNAQADFQVGYPTSTGFYLDTSDGGINQNDENYIYYAHA